MSFLSVERLESRLCLAVDVGVSLISSPNDAAPGEVVSFEIEISSTPELSTSIAESATLVATSDADGLDDVHWRRDAVFADQVFARELNGPNGFVVQGEDRFDNLASDLSAIGDVNGDGFDDFVLGAPGYAPGLTVDPTSETRVVGAAYVIFGSSTPSAPLIPSPSKPHPVVEVTSLNGTNGFAVRGNRPLYQFGWAVAAAGDVNSDGIDDVLITSKLDQMPPQGESHVVFGREDGFPASIDVESLNGANGFEVNRGIAVGGAGDFNGDGIEDFLIANYLVFGSAEFPATLDVTKLDGTDGVALGSTEHQVSVAGIGDFNADGLDDVLIGRPRDGIFPPVGSEIDGGRVFAVFGRSQSPSVIDLGGLWDVSDDVLNGADGVAVNGNFAGYPIGANVSGGDFNGDGIPDLLIDHPTADAVIESPPRDGVYLRTQAGLSYVIYGRPAVVEGTGSINDTSVIREGESIVYTFTGTIPHDASSDFSFEFAIASDIEDVTPENNLLSISGFVGSTALPGDINLDGEVNFADFLILSANFGTTSAATAEIGDLNNDQAVNFADFLILSDNFGRKLAEILRAVDVAFAP